MTEQPENNPVFVVDCFRVKVAGIQNEAVRKSHGQAVESFNRFMGGTPVTFDDFNEDLLREWVSWIFYQGYSLETVKVYTGRLSALYGKAVKDGVAKANGCFSSVRARLRDASPGGVEVNSDPDCFRKLRRLVRIDCSKNPARQLAKDIVLFSLYNGGLTFDRLAGYRKTDYEGGDRAVLEIVERYSKAKNRYLFPLRQSERTSGQLSGILSSLFADALGMVGINLKAYTSATPVDLWAVAAMRGGISASDIAGCIGSCGMVNPIFSFATRSELSEERIADIRRHVSEILTIDPDYWYAMQFRPRVDYDMIKRRMEETGISFSKSFYPMEEIVRRVGRKMVCESRPVVPGLLFFQCKASALSGIFFHLGDLAWGYRQTRNVRSPYAIISRKDMDTYQKTIGRFTDGMEIYPEGTVHIGEGDRVEIIGGDLMGHPATFEKEIRETSKGSEDVRRIIYRLRLMGNNNIEWVVRVDPRLVMKISDERYETLKERQFADEEC